MNRIKTYLIHVFMPLLLGGLLYIAYRSKSLRMFYWFELIGLNSPISNLRDNLYALKQYIPPWVYFSLPDGLWVYSFTSSILILWKKNNYWILFPIITGIMVEVLQGFSLFPGTFDYLDLTFSIIGLTLSKIIINYKFIQNESTVF